MPTATERILAALRQRFPSREVPVGAYVAIAARVGVSRQLVRKIGAKAGYAVVPAPKRAGPTCPRCGRRVRFAGTVCRPCRWVTVACAQCGKPVQRRSAELDLRSRTGRYTGRVFCDRECFSTFRTGRPRKG